MCHKNKTVPCVYVGWFINTSVFPFSLSSHFCSKGLNQLHFPGLTSVLSHMAEATNICHLEPCIWLYGCYQYTHSFLVETVVLPPRHWRYHLSSRKTITTFIYSHANITLGSAKYWDYKNGNSYHDNNIDINSHSLNNYYLAGIAFYLLQSSPKFFEVDIIPFLYIFLKS